MQLFGNINLRLNKNDHKDAICMQLPIDILRKFKQWSDVVILTCYGLDIFLPFVYSWTRHYDTPALFQLHHFQTFATE